MTASIAALDKAVAEAPEQRKAEHDAYEETRATDTAAKEVLKFAENWLNTFYNPKLYAAPPKRELSAEYSIVIVMVGALSPIAGAGITIL